MKTVAAGIVLYNPDIQRLIENIESVYQQVDIVVLIDNHSNNISLIELEIKRYSNIYLIRNDENLGIASALNIIMEFCENKGYSWVLTLDQDSVCPSNLIKEYNKYTSVTDVAIISPKIVDRNTNFGKGINKSHSKYEMIEKCITSGSLTNVLTWKKVGGFDEKMFIDLVDFDYCKRLTKQGYKILQVNNTELLHEIGHITYHKFLIWKVEVQNHTAFRKYYMARNIVYLTKKYNSSFSLAYLRVMKLFFLTLLYEKEKFKKCNAIIKGICDGMKK